MNSMYVNVSGSSITFSTINMWWLNMSEDFKVHVPTFHVPTLKVDPWSTPWSSIVDDFNGNARVTHWQLPEGCYPMKGVRGYWNYYTEGLDFMCLQVFDGPIGFRTWKTWMVDSPLEWFGMQEYADRVRSGTVLVGGLGLGLVVHHLVKRMDLDEIVVVEINKDVIDLVEPYLPVDHRMLILNEDLYTWLHEPHDRFFNSVIVDTYAGVNCRPEFERAREIVERRLPFPDTLSLYWGFQRLVDEEREVKT